LYIRVYNNLFSLASFNPQYFDTVINFGGGILSMRIIIVDLGIVMNGYTHSLVLEYLKYDQMYIHFDVEVMVHCYERVKCDGDEDHSSNIPM